MREGCVCAYVCVCVCEREWFQGGIENKETDMGRGSKHVVFMRVEGRREAFEGGGHRKTKMDG